jgi:tetratricopeptide (TPR) repeat protein
MTMVAFLLTHLVLSVLLGCFYLRKKRLDIRFLSAWLTILIFPVGGILIYWIMNIYYARANEEEPIEDLSNYEKEAPLFELIEPLNVSAETDVASLEETLLIADFGKRREVILNLLKEDASEHVNYIDLALHNEDSETAHYAASGILHTKRKLDSSLSIFSELYQNDPSDMTVAYTYADLLRQYLTTVRMDPADKLVYTYENIHVLEKIVKKKSSRSISQLIRLIDLLLEIEDFNRTNFYCNELWEKYPDSEEKFLTMLKSYFMMKDKQHFELVFKRFRDSDIYFSSETMNVIRLWLGTINNLKNVH